MKLKAHRGTVLVVVLGVLAVLSLLGITFVLVESLERQVSRNYLDAVLARFAARGGVEFAIGHLRQLHQIDLVPASGPEPWQYWGDDTLENGSGPVNVPLSKALNPSFADEEDGNAYSGPVTPRKIVIDGAPRGFSGSLGGGSRAKNGEIFTLKVTDASGKIFINEGGKHYQGNGSRASRNLRRILNRLGEALSPPINGLGAAILEARPPDGYMSVEQLDSVLPREDFDRVKDFLTAHAWVDPHVANPVPFSADHVQSLKKDGDVPFIDTYRESTGVFRFGRGKDYRGQPVTQPLRVYPSTVAALFAPDSLAHGVYGTDELNPQWIEITSRAPINVNTAPREVLIAVLSDLRGVFMSERRRNSIETSNAGGYYFTKAKYTYSPDPQPVPADMGGYFTAAAINVPEGDELGFLYETYPIVGPAAPNGKPGIRAADIADAIIACRERKKGYEKLPFGGPFRTWRQFNAFCDSLVEDVLKDRRGAGEPAVFFDHQGNPPVVIGNITGYAPLVPSDFQRRQASQAIADVLKANFNPNLTLNELNPDRNLFLLVDKTDLVVNSTEFIFTPTGYYDIESIGRVLKPDSGDDSLAPGVDNTLIAEAEIRCGVKLFDLIRETTQAEFSAGECSARTGGPATNNGLSLEVGPEPDNGNGPAENKWGGSIALPTVGGIGQTKARGELRNTPQGAAELGSKIHSHLSWDCDAHRHADGDDKRQDLGSHKLPGEGVDNYPDPGETVGGPYDPTDRGGNYYRLSRSFELPKASGGGTQPLPTLASRAPMDLRIDGVNLERNCGLAYWISKSSYVSTTSGQQGAISYWVKPNFFPERSGKVRGYVDMNRRHGISADSYWHPWLGMETNSFFFNLWNPGHNRPPDEPPTDEWRMNWYEGGDWRTREHGVVPFRPESLIFGVGYGWVSGYACLDYFAHEAPVNHLAHNHEKFPAPFPTRSYFRGHEWMHVVLEWGPAGSPYRQYVNGKLIAGSLTISSYSKGFAPTDWTRHQNGEQNSLRIGSVSRICSKGSYLDPADPSHYNNFSADSTLDEIYFWNARSDSSSALGLWYDGRYAPPRTPSEGVFTSREIKLEPAGARSLPPPSAALPPSDPLPGTSTDPSAGSARLFGIAWTWFGEDPGSVENLTPTLTDHAVSPPNNLILPTVEASIQDRTTSNVTDSGYSALRDSSGRPIEVPVGSSVRYKLTFRIPGARILLATPVVDDVTLFVAFDQDLFTYYRNVVAQ